MRKGSALLIVLGMMAFMVVSAVAFSVFMRQSRLPSSFLRQRVTSSQLVKAGLANAMREIDESIGNDPYPGIRLGNNNNGNSNGSDRNYWKNRVFMGDRSTYNQGENGEVGLETVSTLTLEGLAYLPPPLVNTVRYWSRRTRTAAWQPLGYDAGRFAYTAVNVSDYFDLNRIRANAMRDSSPGNRISMGYLFENDQHTGDGTISPAAFEQFVAATTNDAFKTRLVSLADYNLAVDSGEYGNAGFESAFCRYIKNPPKDGSFYGSGRDDAKRQKFVTDSWYPGSLTNLTALLLTDVANGQPFSGKVNATLDDLQLIRGSEAYKIFAERIDLCSFAALYDYLDGDNDRYGHVPISLAIPTIERTPMLTGLCVVPSGFGLKLAPTPDSPKALPSTSSGSTTVTKQLYTWVIDSVGDDPKLTVSACGVFPFKRGFQGTGSYRFQVMVRGFFSDYQFEETRLPDGIQAVSKNFNANWTAMKDAALVADDKGWFTLVEEKPIDFSSSPLTDNQTTFDVIGIDIRLPANLAQGCPVYGLRKESAQNSSTGQTVENFYYDDSGMDPAKLLRYYTGNGASISKTYSDTGPTLYLNYHVWARIVDEENRTVDLVPAMIADDQLYNGLVSGDCGGDAHKICGSRTPILPIVSSAVTEFKKVDFENAANSSPVGAPTQPNVDVPPLAIYCDDPRFNYAPEDWYKSGNGDVQGSAWLSKAKSRCNGADGRAHDIFQFVSDVGFEGMQSLGELQFLPYLSPFGPGKGGVPNSGFYAVGRYDNRHRFATSAEDCVNADYAWKTHWAFGDYADNDDGPAANPENWGVRDSDGGLRVSPYADRDLLMAALANTPYDWSVAYGDTDLTLASGRKYCFSGFSASKAEGAEFKWEDLTKVAETIRSTFIAKQGKHWESVWRDDLDWEADNFLGSNLGRDKLHDVDRKFLYSYWKSCFGNEQQLFLIFVRAEPAVMGGSNAGHTPSQLGARAVALVWREPVSTVRSTTGGTPPHRMRILFYHQFE